MVIEDQREDEVEKDRGVSFISAELLIFVSLHSYVLSKRGKEDINEAVFTPPLAEIRLASRSKTLW